MDVFYVGQNWNFQISWNRNVPPLQKTHENFFFVLIFAFFLLWAPAAFFSSCVFLWNVLHFWLGFFLMLLWSKLCCFAETLFNCGIPSSSPSSLQLYRLWRLSQLCSCGSKLGRRDFLCGNCSKSYQLCMSVQTCPQGQSLGLYQAWWQYSKNIFVPLERLVINEAFKYSLTLASEGDSFFWLIINHTEGTFTLEFYESPNI